MLILIFLVIVLATGLSALFKLGLALGLCGIFAPLLALNAGSGIARASRGHTATWIWGGLVFHSALLTASLLWAWKAGWHIHVFGYDLSGTSEIFLASMLGIWGLRPTVRELQVPDALKATASDYRLAAHKKASAATFCLSFAALLWFQTSHVLAMLLATRGLFYIAHVLSAIQESSPKSRAPY